MLHNNARIEGHWISLCVRGSSIPLPHAGRQRVCKVLPGVEGR